MKPRHRVILIYHIYPSAHPPARLSSAGICCIETIVHVFELFSPSGKTIMLVF